MKYRKVYCVYLIVQFIFGSNIPPLHDGSQLAVYTIYTICITKYFAIDIGSPLPPTVTGCYTEEAYEKTLHFCFYKENFFWLFDRLLTTYIST